MYGRRLSFSFSALLLSPATVFLSSSATGQGTGIELVNQTQKSLVSLYAVPSGRSSFGPERLSGQPVRPNQSLLFQRSPGQCIYDFLTVFEDGENVADYGVNLCDIDGGTYTLFDSEGEEGKLAVFNGTDSALQEILIEGASSGPVGSPPEPDSAELDDQSSAPTPSPNQGGDQAALCEQFSSQSVREVCYQALEEMRQIEQENSEIGASNGGMTIDGRSTRVESSRNCVDDVCDQTFMRKVGLLGSYVIKSQEDAWILTNAADLVCETIQYYDVTATFENGRQEKKNGVNLCGQDNIVFGQPKQGEQRHITVANTTDQSPTEKNLVLKEIYIAPPQSSTWGYNLLESSGIEPGDEGQITYIDNTDQCFHDVRAVFVNPSRVEHLEPVQWDGIDLCDLNNNTLVYGIPAQVSRGQMQPAIATTPQVSNLATKQLSRVVH